MTKQVDSVFRQWWPMFIWIIGLAFATGMIVNKLDNISIALAEIRSDRKSDVASISILEAHVCVLDTLHKISCIRAN